MQTLLLNARGFRLKKCYPSSSLHSRRRQQTRERQIVDYKCHLLPLAVRSLGGNEMAESAFEQEAEGNTARNVRDDADCGNYDWEDKCGHGGIYSAEHPLVRYEVIDGKVRAMSSPSIKHSVTVTNIGTAIKNALDKYNVEHDTKRKCRVFMQDLDFHYHYNVKGKEKDFVMPDVAVACGKDLLGKGYYRGVPKFAAEVISPSSITYDRTTKLKIYEEAGVSEYWIVTPMSTVEIYYLEDGRYILHESYVLCDDDEVEEYNANKELSLRCFPDIKMTLGSIFE